jgi:hypothetical protein
MRITRNAHTLPGAAVKRPDAAGGVEGDEFDPEPALNALCGGLIK